MSESAVEGLGDDVLIPLLVFVGLTLLTVWLLRRSFATQGPIAGRNAPEGLLEARRALNVHRERPANEDSACPICLEDKSFVCGTNCGHSFCAHCLLSYWRNGIRSGTLQCPMCRRNITLLLEGFTASEKATAQGQQSLVDIRAFNRRFESRSSWLESLRDVPALIDYATSHVTLLQLVRFREMLIALAAIVYLLSPIDLIPEAVYGVFGLLDDMFVLACLVVFIAFVVRNVIRYRQ